MDDSLCQDWCEGQGLDEACLSKLLELDADTRQTVINGFQPKPGTSNVPRLFMGYVRSIELAAGRLNGGQHTQWKGKEKGGAKGGAKGAKGGFKGYGKEAPRPRTVQSAAAQLQEEAYQFAESWGLDEECVAELLAQPLQVVADVMATFSPRPETRNVRTLFFSFLKSVADASRGGPVAAVQKPMVRTPIPVSRSPAYNLEEDALSFVEHFGLDEECLQQLLQQPPEVAQAVMAGFQPRQDTQNPHGLFISYLRSVAAGSAGSKGLGYKGAMGTKGGPKGGSKGGSMGSVFSAMPRSTQQGFAARATPYRRPMPFQGQAIGGAQRAVVAAVSEEELLDFVLAWNLDQECMDQLQAQDPETQRLVLTNFQPREGTANPSGLFMGYLRSLVRAGKGKGFR